MTPAKRAAGSPIKAQRTPSHKMSAKQMWSVPPSPGYALGSTTPAKSKLLSWNGEMDEWSSVQVIDTTKGLGFDALYRKADEFLLTFDAYLMGELAGAEMLRDEQADEMATIAQGKSKARAQLESAQVEQDRLWVDLAHQKEEDERERQALSALEAQHQETIRRLATVQEEVNACEAQYRTKLECLEQKKAELHRARLSTQQDRQRLEQLVGVKIVPQQGNLRVYFTHVNPYDSDSKASFMLDMSDQRVYSGTLITISVGSHRSVRSLPISVASAHANVRINLFCLVRHARPKLPKAKLDELTAQVNRTRDPWNLIKSMRALFRAQAEQLSSAGSATAAP